MRKPRSDSNLKTLPRETQEAIMERLNAKGGSYQSVKEWLFKEWDITTSVGALQDFYSWASLRSRMEQAETTTQDLQEMLKNAEFGLSDQQLAQIGNLMFLSEATKAQDPELFFNMMKLVLANRKLDQNDRRLELDRRRIEILEKKAAQADAAKEVINSNLSPEEQRKRLKEILK